MSAYVARWNPRAFLHARGGWEVVHARSGRYASGPYSRVEDATAEAERRTADSRPEAPR